MAENNDKKVRSAYMDGVGQTAFDANRYSFKPNMKLNVNPDGSVRLEDAYIEQRRREEAERRAAEYQERLRQERNAAAGVVQYDEMGNPVINDGGQYKPFRIGGINQQSGTAGTGQGQVVPIAEVSDEEYEKGKEAVRNVKAAPVTEEDKTADAAVDEAMKHMEAAADIYAQEHAGASQEGGFATPDAQYGVNFQKQREWNSGYYAALTPEAAERQLRMMLLDPAMQESIMENARKKGVTPDEYLQNDFLPKFQEGIYNRLVEKNAPKSTLDYVASGVWQSIIGRVLEANMYDVEQRQLLEAGRQKYGETAGSWEQLGSGVVQFTADAAPFAVFGAGARFGSGLLMQLAPKTISTAAYNAGMATMQSALVGMQYGATSTAAAQAHQEGRVDVGNAMLEGVKEMPTFAALGMFGAKLNQMTTRMVGEYGSLGRSVVVGGKHISTASAGEWLAHNAGAVMIFATSDLVKNPELDLNGTDFVQAIKNAGLMQMSMVLSGAINPGHYKGSAYKPGIMSGETLAEMRRAGFNVKGERDAWELMRRLEAENLQSGRMPKFLSNEKLSLKAKNELLAAMGLKGRDGNTLHIDMGATQRMETVRMGENEWHVREWNDTRGNQWLNDVHAFRTKEEADAYVAAHEGDVMGNRLSELQSASDAKWSAGAMGDAIHELAEETGVQPDMLLSLCAMDEAGMEKLQNQLIREAGASTWERIAEKYGMSEELAKEIASGNFDSIKYVQEETRARAERMRQELGSDHDEATKTIEAYFGREEGWLDGVRRKPWASMTPEEREAMVRYADELEFRVRGTGAAAEGRSLHQEIVSDAERQQWAQQGMDLLMGGDEDAQRGQAVKTQVSRDRLVSMTGEEFVRALEERGLAVLDEYNVPEGRTIDYIKDYMMQRDITEGMKKGVQEAMQEQMDAAAPIVQGMSNQSDAEGRRIVTVATDGERAYVVRSRSRDGMMIVTPVVMDETGNVAWESYDDANTSTMRVKPAMRFTEMGESEVLAQLVPEYNVTMERIFGEKEPKVGDALVDEEANTWMLGGMDAQGNWILEGSDGTRQMMADEQVRALMRENERLPYEVDEVRKGNENAAVNGGQGDGNANGNANGGQGDGNANAAVNGGKGDAAAPGAAGRNQGAAGPNRRWVEDGIYEDEGGARAYAPIDETIAYMTEEADGDESVVLRAARNKRKVLQKQIQESADRLDELTVGREIAEEQRKFNAMRSAEKYWAAVEEEVSGMQYDRMFLPLSERKQAAMDKINKALGTELVFSDNMQRSLANAGYKESREGSDQVNGFYKDGRIVVNARTKRGYAWAFGHESGHRMAELSPEAYKAWRDAILKEVYGDGLDKAMKEKRKVDVYRKATDEAVMEELANDAIGEVFNDVRKLERIAAKLDGNSIGFLRDQVREWLKSGSGVTFDDVLEAAKGAGERAYNDMKERVDVFMGWQNDLAESEKVLAEAYRKAKEAAAAAPGAAGRDGQPPLTAGGRAKFSAEGVMDDGKDYYQVAKEKKYKDVFEEISENIVPLQRIPTFTRTLPSGEKHEGLFDYVGRLNDILHGNKEIDQTISATLLLSRNKTKGEARGQDTQLGNPGESTRRRVALTDEQESVLKQAISAGEAEIRRRREELDSLFYEFGVDKQGGISAENLYALFETYKPTEYQRVLMEKAMEALGNWDSRYYIKYPENSMATGRHNRNNGEILLAPDRFVMDIDGHRVANTIIHELIHKATNAQFYLYRHEPSMLSDGMRKEIKEFMDAYEAVEKKWPKDERGYSRYHFADSPSELLAGITSKHTRDLLRNLEYDKEQSVLDKIKNFILSCLGVKRSTKGNVLTTVEKALDTMLEEFDDSQHGYVMKLGKTSDIVYSKEAATSIEDANRSRMEDIEAEMRELDERMFELEDAEKTESVEYREARQQYEDLNEEYRGLSMVERMTRDLNVPKELQDNVTQGVLKPTSQDGNGSKSTAWVQLELDFGSQTESEPSAKKGKTKKTPEDFRLRKLKPGETCLVERRYVETGQFSFSGKEKVESPEDIAYIFRSLEDSAIENIFFVLIKNGEPTIIHAGMGTMVGSLADGSAPLMAIDKIKPDRIVMLHNHPSGQLKPSRDDFNLHSSLKKMFGDKLADSIIIDQKSGKFIQFNDFFDWTADRPESADGEKAHKVYSFSRNVFHPDYTFEGQKITTHEDIAAFVSSHRLGDRGKIGAIICNNNLDIVGNILLDVNEITEENYGKIAKNVVNSSVAMSGRRVFLHGSGGMDAKTLSKLKDRIGNLSGNFVLLTDAIKMEGNNAHTAEALIGESTGRISFSVEPARGDEKDVNNGGNVLLIADKSVSLQPEDVEYVREVRDSMPRSKAWRSDFPKASILTSKVQSRFPELYQKAKSGDNEAAYQLVKKLMENSKVADKIRQTAAQYPDAIVAYPHALEEGGMNKIPLHVATALKDAGLNRADNIFVSNKPRHTGANDESRLMRRARFEGDVVKGGKYILVDDQVSSGATLRDMKDYIEANGGEVVQIMGMTASMGGHTIAPTEAHLNKLNELGVTDEQLRQYGIAESTRHLTDGEAAKLIRLVNGRGTGSTPEGPDGGRSRGRQTLGTQLVKGEDDSKLPSFSKENAPIFESNAAKAIAGLKQEKATPEQWLAMLQKAGGIKAGEDKWMGLSDWLRERAKDGAKTLTKEEVMRYIAENTIQVEEVHYGEDVVIPEVLKEYQDRFKEYVDEAAEEMGEGSQPDEWNERALEMLSEDEGEDITMAVTVNSATGELEPTYDYDGNLSEAAQYFFTSGETKPIDEKRLEYTTEGLENKREIALTVPGIEPYQSEDMVHFGDADGGRSVAWVRFGDAESVSTTDGHRGRVLVIDEIQNNRHQDAREHGYQRVDKTLKRIQNDTQKAISEHSQYVMELQKKYGYREYFEAIGKEGGVKANLLTQEEAEKMDALWDAYVDALNIEEQYVKEHPESTAQAIYNENPDAVPDAPFDKNWHELAMKRILRLAAEEGYDKVAWTTGAQQAERYSLGAVVGSIHLIDGWNDGKKHVKLTKKDGTPYHIFKVNEDGIAESTYEGFDGKPLTDIVGRDMATKIMNSPDGTTLEGNDLMVGGEGMSGFYDKMLPAFMNKYGKKWGVKVGEVELDLPNEADRVMHAIDVTDAMRESVMQGQPMFSKEAMQPMEGEHFVDFAERVVSQRAQDELDRESHGEHNVKFSREKDPETLKRLEGLDPEKDCIPMYRAMQVVDGRLYPPMAGMVDGKMNGEGFVVNEDGTIESYWEKSDERPDLVLGNGKFRLNKGNGKYVDAAYNPYIHTSYTPLNDQFKEAQTRPNLVVVKVLVPKSELTSGYKAEGAKDAVGAVEWNAGVIQRQLEGKRKVVLTRWDKPVEVVSDEEVAKYIVDEMFGGRKITMPTNVVTPGLRKAMEDLGVPFVETDNKGRIKEGEHAGKNYSEVYGPKNEPDGPGGGGRKPDGQPSGTVAFSKEDDMQSIRDAIAETDVNPTEAQKKNGNYKMGHAHLDGYQITIENPAGSVRRGTDENGNAWEVKMANTYGYIRGTRGKDGDHIDIFLSENPTEGNVYVVDQVNPQTGEFDEHKVMYGFGSTEEARQAYLSNYSEGWQGLGNITEVSKEDFRKWIASSTKKTKPFAEYKMVANAKDGGRKPSLLSDRIMAKHDVTDDELKESANVINNIADAYIGKKLEHDKVAVFMDCLKDVAEIIPEEIDFTDENYNAMFGQGVKTPIGKVKMSDGQKKKMSDLHRTRQLGLAKRTLEAPDFIIEKPSSAKDGQETERPYSYLFVKTFVNEDGTEVTHYYSVTVQRDGLEISMSNYDPKEKQVKRELREGKLTYINKVTLPTDASSSAQGDQFTNTAGSISAGKGKGKSTNSHNKADENTFNSAELQGGDDIHLSMEADVRGEKFKNWFGDWEKDPENASKVVDENGEPLVVYKRRAEDTDVINTEFGSFFSDVPLEDESFGSVVTPVYLNIRKPLVLDANGVSWSYPMWYFLADKEYKLPQSNEEYEKILKERNLLKLAPKEIWDIVKDDDIELDFEDAAWIVNKYKLPYDGIVIKNIGEGTGGNQYVTDYIALNETQIKHATENNGEYSAEDKRIRFSAELDAAKRELKDYPDAMRILSERIEPRDINEVAASVLSSAKLMWDDSGEGDFRRKGLRSMMGWKEGERKKFLTMIRTEENGGITLARAGEIVEQACRDNNIPFDENDANAGLNALQDVLGSCASYGEVVRYAEENRIQEAYESARQDQDMEAQRRDEWYRQNYGMSYDEYQDWVDSANQARRESEAGTQKDKDMIEWLRDRNQRQAEQIGKFQAKLDELRQAELGRPLVQHQQRVIDQARTQIDEQKQRIRDLEEEKRHKYNYERAYREIKETKQELAKFVREQMVAEDMPFVSKRQLNKLLATIERTNTLAQLEEAVSNVVEVATDGRVKHLEQRLGRLMRMKVQDINGRGMSVAKTVDDRTRRIFEDIQRHNGIVGVQSMQEELDELYRSRRAKRGEINGILQELADATDESKKVILQARIDEGEKQWMRLSEQIAKKETEVSKARSSRAGLNEKRIKTQIQELEAKMSKASEEGSAELWTDADSDKLIALKAVQVMYDSTMKEGEINDLQDRLNTLYSEIRDLRSDANGKPDSERKRINELIRLREEDVRQIKDLKVNAMQDLATMITNSIETLEGLMDNGRNNLKQKIDEEIMHRIHVMKNSFNDVRNRKTFNDNAKKDAGGFDDALRSDLFSFEHMCKAIVQNGFGKDGFIYEYFVKGKDGVMAAYNVQQTGLREQKKTLNDKVREIFGTNNNRWDTGEWVIQGNKAATERQEISTWKEDGTEQKVELTKGQAAYLFAVWRMADGKAKLQHQGFRRESIEEIKDFIGDKYIELIDWLQQEYFPATRAKYNERYREMYNTSMASIENYVPLRINPNYVKPDPDLEGTTKHGKYEKTDKKAKSLVARTANLNPIDTTQNLFDVVRNHVNEMERWYAYARVYRDLDAILGSNYFKIQLNSNKPGTYDRFLEAAQIATQSYTPADVSAFEKSMSRLSRNIASSPISFRLYTAIKQLASFPAYWAYANDLGMHKHLAANFGRGITNNTLKWAEEHLPSYKTRVELGDIGDNKLSDEESTGKIQTTISRINAFGMIPNRKVDAFTCAVGAKSIYDYNMEKARKQIEKNETLSEEQKTEAMKEAERLALMEADIFYNATQQSSHPAFLSAQQKSKGFLNQQASLFQNSNMGYRRRYTNAIDNLIKITREKDKLVEHYTAQYIDEGMEEDAAEKAARKYIRSMTVKSAKDAYVFGWLMKTAWTLVSSTLFGWNGDDWKSSILNGLYTILTNDTNYEDFYKSDDESSEEYHERIALKCAKMLGLAALTPLQGSAWPNVLISMLNYGKFSPGMTFDEITGIVEDWNGNGKDTGEALKMLMLKRAPKYAGINVDTWANMYYGVEQLVAHEGWKDEKALDFMFIVNAPKSTAANFARKMYGDMPYTEFAEKVAKARHYANSKETLLPLLGVVLNDRDSDKGKGEAKKLVNEYDRTHQAQKSQNEKEYDEIVARGNTDSNVNASEVYNQRRTFFDVVDDSYIAKAQEKASKVDKALQQIENEDAEYNRTHAGEEPATGSRTFMEKYSEDLDVYDMIREYNWKIRDLKAKFDGSENDEKIMDKIREERNKLLKQLKEKGK